MIKPQISSCRQGVLTIIIFGGEGGGGFCRQSSKAPSAADDRKLFQCLNIVSDNKTGPIERGQCDVTLPW